MNTNARVLIASANFRDIGGLRTVDGYQVRTGRLFRSGHLSHLNDTEKKVLTALDLRTVVDLRRPSEISNFPTPDMNEVCQISISVSSEDNEFAVVANLVSNNAPEQKNSRELIQSYFRKNITERLDNFIPVFDAATDPNHHPLLFHCMAGKDRTGFVAGVILRLLGVSESETINDYLLTNELLKNRLTEQLNQERLRIAKQNRIQPADVNEEQLENTKLRIYTQASFLKSSFDAINEKFESLETFRKDGLKISDSRFDSFKESILH
tara:strand:+ start:316 stop:1116 length:801 start_codon:yes stop_codon:yes gene_type:complete